MENKRISIREKLESSLFRTTAISLLLTTIAVIICMFIMYRYNARALINQLQQNMINNVKFNANFADVGLSSYGEYLQFWADSVHEFCLRSRDVTSSQPYTASRFTMRAALDNAEIDPASVSEELSLFKDTQVLVNIIANIEKDSITSFHICTEKGLYLSYDTFTGNQPYRKFLDSSWYLKGKTANAPYYSDFFVSDYASDRQLIVTCAVPFFDASNKFAGVVCMDMAMSEVYNEIMNGVVMPGSSTMLVDNNGKLVSLQGEAGTIHSDPDIDSEIVRHILSGDEGISLSASGMYCAYAPVKYTGWSIYTKIPESYVLSSMQTVNYAVILSIAALIAIMFVTMLAIRKISAKVSAPIIELSRDVKAMISDWDLDHKAKIHDYDELGDLAQDINELAFTLKEYMHDFSEVAALNQQVTTELNVATRIQADMLPKKFPAFPDRKEFDIYATMTPAKEVGGDFYDFFLIDDDHLAIVIADVSDKGVPAALFMVIAKTLIKTRAQMGGSPSEILFDVNNQLHEGNDEMLFVTVWLGILEISTGKITASNAGHECPAIEKADGKFELFEVEHDPAIAVMPDMEFSENEFTLKPGEGLYLYTDGVAEANNPNGELFGTDRMLDALNKHSKESAQDILHSIQGELDGFVKKAPQFDDITMLFLRYVSNEEEHDHLTIKAETKNLYEVTGFIERNLTRWNCPDEIAAQIVLAAEETFTNIAFYAYETDTGKVTIDIKREGHDAVVVFSDSGRPFNPLTSNITSDEHKYKGLGIYIVKESMDELTYNYRNKKNVLQFRKSMLLEGEKA